MGEGSLGVVNMIQISFSLAVMSRLLLRHRRPRGQSHFADTEEAEQQEEAARARQYVGCVVLPAGVKYALTSPRARTRASPE